MVRSKRHAAKGSDDVFRVQNDPPKRPRPPLGIDVLVTPGCFATSVTATLDVLAVARTIGHAGGLDVPELDVRVLSVDGARVRSSSGLTLDVDGAASTTRGDVVVVCGPGMADARRVLDDVRGETGRALRPVLRAARARGALLCASCSSTFLLAEAGVLDGLGATTSWWLGPTFRATYPAVRLDEEQRLVDAGAVITAGAALSHADLMLHLVRRIGGPSLGEACAKYLVVDETAKSQACFRVLEHLAQADAAVAHAEKSMRAAPAKPPTLAELARQAGLTPRTLSRRFVTATGLSPKRFLRRVRLELAAHLLCSSSDAVATVAERVGYDDERAFRRAFQREHGSSPSRYRAARAETRA
jgi:transcriptional regulator GlxA family with amidase domain